jgi:hypothetical protein
MGDFFEFFREEAEGGSGNIDNGMAFLATAEVYGTAVRINHLAEVCYFTMHWFTQKN